MTGDETHETDPAATRDLLRRALDRLRPHDALEAEHLAETRDWVTATSDLCRRVRRPVAPRQHLVAYFLLVDGGSVLLGDHVTSGLWLPSGGHVEPGEDPVDTVRRECREELQVEARFHPALGPWPLFLTVTETGGSDPHRDVSLWYVLDADREDTLSPDPREYRSVRWWTVDEVAAADPASFDPHMGRMLDKLAGARP